MCSEYSLQNTTASEHPRNSNKARYIFQRPTSKTNATTKQFLHAPTALITENLIHQQSATGMTQGNRPLRSVCRQASQFASSLPVCCRSCPQDVTTTQFLHAPTALITEKLLHQQSATMMTRGNRPVCRKTCQLASSSLVCCRNCRSCRPDVTPRQFLHAPTALIPEKLLHQRSAMSTTRGNRPVCR
jgi:hypothetical protein